MQIHRQNHTRPTDSHTDRIQVNPTIAKDFKILRAGTESGIEIEVKTFDYTWTVSMSPDETEQIIRSLLKK
jgi:hypothetical protein